MTIVDHVFIGTLKRVWCRYGVRARKARAYLRLMTVEVEVEPDGAVVLDIVEPLGSAGPIVEWRPGVVRVLWCTETDEAIRDEVAAHPDEFAEFVEAFLYKHGIVDVNGAARKDAIA